MHRQNVLYYVSKMVVNSATLASHLNIAFVNRDLQDILSQKIVIDLAISSNEVAAFLLFQEAYLVSTIIAVSLSYT